MVFILKSIPIVEMNVVLNASSENLKDRNSSYSDKNEKQDLPE